MKSDVEFKISFNSSSDLCSAALLPMLGFVFMPVIHRKEELAISLSMPTNYWGMGGENVGSHKNH